MIKFHSLEFGLKFAKKGQKMLKKFSKISLFVAILAVFAAAEPYKVLEKPLSNEANSVVEAFSFTCGACYNHHKFGTMAAIKAKHPQLSYKIYPVKSITFGEEFARLHAYAEAQDGKSGLDGTSKLSLSYKLADAYFVAIFERKQSWASSQSFYELGLAVLDITQNELNAFLASAEGRKIYASYDKAELLAQQYGGTPAFAVRGKYNIIMREIKSLDEMIKIVGELSGK